MTHDRRTSRGRETLASLCFGFLLWAGSAACGAAATGTAPASSLALVQQQSNGLTVVARRAGAAPVAALEIWIRCPANDYDGSNPGIARLAALALVEEKSQTSLSLRDATRIAGGHIAVSVYAESTEIAILAPSYAASALLDKLSATVAKGYVDQAAFDTARTRLAAGQVAAGDVADQELRDALFSQLFSGGPLRDSTYGTPKSLRDATLVDVTKFIGRAYVPANEVVVAVGDLDAQDVGRHLSAFSAASGTAQPMPASPIASYGGAPFAIHNDQADAAGVGLAWVGPPIADERAATAMDFLSDYLTDPTSGALTKAVADVDSDADFSGQFITLRDPGVFFVTAAGKNFDIATLPQIIRTAVQASVGHELPRADFDRARDAYVTHLLRAMQSVEGLADNYGWYYAQGALAYSPSATAVPLSGAYFDQVASLTPEYVYSVARKYLLGAPAVVILTRSITK
jgi:predicted Zn-dependent peptidase